MAAVVAPAAIVRATGGVSVGWGLPWPWRLGPPLLGALLLGLGLLLMARTIALFATAGEGTLAPWDPPRRLVVRGIYRRVRNPMISGVLFVLLGEAAVAGSPALLGWFALFFTLNAIYIPLVEERGLLSRFGEDYETYRRHVPRWLPRPRPWVPPDRP
jgi:protein-S-isoprenylcysteine O-methyltransferase Ste14